MATKLDRVITSGRGFSTQTTKSSLISCHVNKRNVRGLGDFLAFNNYCLNVTCLNSKTSKEISFKTLKRCIVLNGMPNFHSHSSRILSFVFFSSTRFQLLATYNHHEVHTNTNIVGKKH